MAYINENVVFRTIEEPFCYGCFDDLELIINKNANTFNATKLAHQGGKRFRNWLENQHTINLIMCLPSCSNEDTLEAKKERFFKRHIGGSTDIDKVIQGTYIPQELLLNLANWISPECFFKTTKIVSSHNINITVENHKEDNEKLNSQVENLIKRNNDLTYQIEQLEYQNQYQATQIIQHVAKANELASKIEILTNHNQQQANQINQKDIKISKQASEIIHQTGRIQQLVDKNQQLLDQIAQQVAKANEQASAIEHLTCSIEHQKQQLTEQIDSLQTRIERYEAYERDIVPATMAKSKWHTFILVDKNDGSRSPYYVLRVQRRSRKQRLKHLKIKYPRMEVVFEMDRLPNSINLVNRMRERLTNVKIHFNHLKLLNDYTVHDLIQDIEALANNRQLLKLG